MGYLTDLQNKLAQAESFESAEEYADAVQIQKNIPIVAQRKHLGGVTPKFKAQFDITIEFLKTGMGWINQQLPIPLFGASDFFSQYSRAFSGLSGLVRPPRVYVYPFVTPTFVGLQATAGDIIIVFEQDTDSAAIRINCKNVAYASLVTATLSDRFLTNLIRISLPSTTNVAQFNQNIEYLRQGLFGRSIFDSLNPLSYKNPQQFQANVIDMPLTFSIDKETSLKTYISTGDYPATTQQIIESFSIFVESSVKTAY